MKKKKKKTNNNKTKQNKTNKQRKQMRLHMAIKNNNEDGQTHYVKRQKDLTQPRRQR